MLSAYSCEKAAQQFTLLTLVVLIQLHALECSTTCDELVGEFSLVVVAPAAIHLLVGVLSFVY